MRTYGPSIVAEYKLPDSAGASAGKRRPCLVLYLTPVVAEIIQPPRAELLVYGEPADGPSWYPMGRVSNAREDTEGPLNKGRWRYVVPADGAEV